MKNIISIRQWFNYQNFSFFTAFALLLATSAAPAAFHTSFFFFCQQPWFQRSLWKVHRAQCCTKDLFDLWRQSCWRQPALHSGTLLLSALNAWIYFFHSPPQPIQPTHFAIGLKHFLRLCIGIRSYDVGVLERTHNGGWRMVGESAGNGMITILYSIYSMQLWKGIENEKNPIRINGNGF